MKAIPILICSLVALTTGNIRAQDVAAPAIDPMESALAQTSPDSPSTVESAVNETPAAPTEGFSDPASPAQAPPSPAAAGADPSSLAAAPFAPLEQQKQEMQESEEGFIIKDAALNDIFQFLSKSAGRQYFHNSKIGGPDYLVTGHLNDGNPLQQMEELAFMYGLSLHTKGNTIYALTQAQLSQLPSAEFHYQLRYLRPTDIEQIKELIKPMLSPGTGIVNFEPKTNTVIIIDSAHRIEQARALLHGIDKAKGQIIVETKILRVNSTAAERTGVNWATSLGANGVPIGVARDLGAVLGLPTNFTSILTDPLTPGFTFPSNANLVITPVQLNGVLRALAEGVLASQISNPALITEDNEMASISIIDRIPIITTTTTGAAGAAGATGGANVTTTEEVRYKIDSGDPTIDSAPDKHREIGISINVIPTLLPDGTIRMKIRPRSAQISEEIVSLAGNKYPRVTESMIESIARVPDGCSLVIGGFYGEAQKNEKTKIPLLGDIPALNFFFKSKDSTKEKTSLVFIVTPTSYNPAKASANNSVSSRIKRNTTLDCEHDWVDPHNPGPAHEPNLKRSLRGLQPTEVPYYPRADELEPAPAPPPATHKTPKFTRLGK
jgi:type II secretory pathway component GspD/PulD (secretin)